MNKCFQDTKMFISECNNACGNTCTTNISLQVTTNSSQVIETNIGKNSNTGVINNGCYSSSEGHIGLERKVTKLEAMLKMLQEDLKKVGVLRHCAHIYMYSQYYI